MERGHCLLVWSSNLLSYHQTNPVLPLWTCPFSATSCVVAFGPCKSWDQASFRSWWNLHRLHRNNKLMNIHSKLVSKRVTLSFPLYLCLSKKNAHTILMTLFMAWTYPVYHTLSRLYIGRSWQSSLSCGKFFGFWTPARLETTFRQNPSVFWVVPGTHQAGSMAKFHQNSEAPAVWSTSNAVQELKAVS